MKGKGNASPARLPPILVRARHEIDSFSDMKLAVGSYILAAFRSYWGYQFRAWHQLAQVPSGCCKLGASVPLASLENADICLHIY